MIPLRLFESPTNVSVIDLINRFHRPRSQIPEILGYQCDGRAHALCKARHDRLTVYERNRRLSRRSSRGETFIIHARIFPAGTSDNRSLKRGILRLLSIRAPIIPRSFTLEDFETKRFLPAALTISDAPTVPRNVLWIYPIYFVLNFFFFSLFYEIADFYATGQCDI